MPVMSIHTGDRFMTRTTTLRRTVRPGLFSLALAGALSLGATAALAGACPADKVVASGKGQAPGPTMPQGVTDVVIASTDLAKEPANIQGRQFRLRRLEVQPGGVVPWHSHGDRPAIIYVISGEIVEYASTCAVPIVHRAGEATAERSATSHWWKNTGSAPVVLLSADLLHDPNDAHTM
jgi:quercetin dioxygenase-like cupin family protein